MNTEQERAAFEAWYLENNDVPHEAIKRKGDGYAWIGTDEAWEIWQAAQAALQSQVKNDTTLFCDLKTDEEKCAFFLSGRGYETGVIAQAIQNDVAMAYHRCAEYKKELEALQSQDREDAERLDWLLRKLPGDAIRYCVGVLDDTADIDEFREAIDHARRIEEN